MTVHKEILNARVSYLTEHKNDVNQQVKPKKISKKNMSIGIFKQNLYFIDIVLNELFKIAMNSFEKKEIDVLNSQTLELFEELEDFIEKTKKFPLHEIQGKTFRALDAK